MCGIAGYIGNLSNFDFPRVITTLAHRGPDSSGVFEDQAKRIGLVHTRLSILDPSSLGHQPIASGDGQLVLVFNGEIYNFRELRIELEQQGHQFLGDSDTEVLLNLYLDHRQTCDDVSPMLRRLNGIFAFAIWDAVRGELLIARDALGVKPIYYSVDGQAFAFASEIKILLLINWRKST